MSREKDQMGTLKFIAIAVVLMILADQYVFGGKRGYIEDLKTVGMEEAVEGPHPGPLPEGEGEEVEDLGEGDKDKSSSQIMIPVPSPQPSPQRGEGEEGVVLPKGEGEEGGKRKIAIIIDDLGMDAKRSREAVNLPAPMTMAFLPYGTITKSLAREAKEKGHTLIIHAPMEAKGGDNIGPGGLKSDMDEAQFRSAFKAMLASFEGYEGVNNHMGSKLTSDAVAMDRLMKMLAEKGLFFIDSKTSGASVARREAKEAGVPFAERHIFLDHIDSAEFVAQALRQAEARARRTGYAILIGHPKDNTLNALRAWIPTLEGKGIELVSVKELVARPPHPGPLPEGEGEEIVALPEGEGEEFITPIELHPLPIATPEPLSGTP
jgi:polysaccharide deacetylase 2 family uncharacterized protein YibQ